MIADGQAGPYRRSMSEHGANDDARRPVFSRRQLLQGALAGGAALPGRASGAEPGPVILDRGDFSLDDIRVRVRVRFRCPAAGRPAKLLVLADTHLFRDDERGAPYREFSGRMAKAYNQTTHFQGRALQYQLPVPAMAFSVTAATQRLQLLAEALAVQFSQSQATAECAAALARLLPGLEHLRWARGKPSGWETCTTGWET